MKGRWLTPQNAPPDKYLVRRLLIPNDYQYIELVNGALLDLCYPGNFEQDGDATPDECADAFWLMYDEYTKPVVEAPGWEDEEDVDGTPSQPWYNDLADWIIEAFLAISGFPQAAIIYSTSIPKLRVAIQNHDLGSLIKILLNNVEMYTGDTYDPIKKLVGHTLDLQAFAAENDLGDPPWELRIVHDGPGPNLPEGQDGFLHVVRKRWTDEMPLQFRQTDPCLLEYSEDGGENWATAADLSLCAPPGGMMTGAMIPWPVATTPADWLRCDGTAVSRTTYADLFALLGTTWGSGDGSTTFNLPDFRDRNLIGDGTLPGGTARTVGQTGGEETHTLNVNELPAHHHQEQAGDGSGNIHPLYYGAGGAGNYSIYPVSTTVTGALYTANYGGDAPHNNMAPFGVVRWIIKT